MPPQLLQFTLLLIHLPTKVLSLSFSHFQSLEIEQSINKNKVVVFKTFINKNINVALLISTIVPNVKQKKHYCPNEIYHYIFHLLCFYIMLCFMLKKCSVSCFFFCYRLIVHFHPDISFSSVFFATFYENPLTKTIFCNFLIVSISFSYFIKTNKILTY